MLLKLARIFVFVSSQVQTFFQIQVSLFTFEHKMSKLMALTNRVVIAYFPYYWSRDIPAYCPPYLACFP